jgi:pyruvate dehydrogenase E2 component (dihydrolipoamide acetyltransferase)
MAERVFAMPDLGEGLEEGRIVEWLIHEGEVVALNQPLVEVETAKAVVEIPSPFAGTIVSMHGAAGEDVAVGAPLVTFAVEGGGARGEEAPVRGSASLAATGVTVGGGDRGPLGPDAPTTPSPPRPGVVRAAPAVRKRARDLGLDLASVVGTGPGGRVTEQDVRAASAANGVMPTPGLSVRREIAEVLTRQAAIPQVTTFRTVDCSALEVFRAELGVSPLPVMIAAFCSTVADHPVVNARWSKDGVETRDGINIGVAVDTERGLVVPVVRDAGGRGIADLRDEVRRLADAARAGTLTLEDATTTPTIAVSNTGSYGSETGTPILSPGTAVTLALGVIAPRALVVEGAVVARPAATISCTFDHRVMDGAAAGRALGDLVALLESAERLGGLPR